MIEGHDRAGAQRTSRQRYAHVAQQADAAPRRPGRHRRHGRSRRLAVAAVILHLNHAFGWASGSLVSRGRPCGILAGPARLQ